MTNRLKIREIRESKNLTQDDVVKASGVPKRSYIDYEKGKTDIPSSRLLSISKALGVSVGDIFGFSDPETRSIYEDRILKDAGSYNSENLDGKTNILESENGLPIEEKIAESVFDKLKPLFEKIELQESVLAKLLLELSEIRDRINH